MANEMNDDEANTTETDVRAEPNACGRLLLMVHEGVVDAEIRDHRKICPECQKIALRLGPTKYDDGTYAQMQEVVRLAKERGLMLAAVWITNQWLATTPKEP